MWYEILKKDLKKRKGINIILLIFISLSAVFLSSSASNIYFIANGSNTFMEYSNVSDVMVFLSMDKEKERFEDWLGAREEITEFDYETLCEIKVNQIHLIKKKSSDSAERQEFVNQGPTNLYMGYAGGTYAKPLEDRGNELVLKEGEVAFTANTFYDNNLDLGDEIEITLGEKTFRYKIAVLCKDIIYGNEFSGMKRFVFHKSDYERMLAAKENPNIVYQYGFNTKTMEDTVSSMNKQGFSSLMFTMTRDWYKLLYVFEMIIGGLVMVVGICLILISLMILRFSIVFTLEENEQEIGVLKAMGMRDVSIQKIYVFKYLVLVTAGAAIGFGLSFPVGRLMLDSVSQSMVLGKTNLMFLIHIVCCITLILIVESMCILFTNKLKKISAVEAIRYGEKGERYSKRKGLRLHAKKHMGTIAFLGLNDVLCNKRRYIVLLVTFCISFVLITIPLNTWYTMNSDEMVSKFDLNTESAVYMNKIEKQEDSSYRYVGELEEALKRVEQELANQGYQASLSTNAYYFQEWNISGQGDETIKVLTNYLVAAKEDFYEYIAGDAPVLENEVAFSKKVMEKNNLHIGDTVTTKIKGEKKNFLITGSYTDYMQLGESARLNREVNMDDEIMSGYGMVMVDMDTDLTQKELADKFSKEFPEYNWYTGSEAIEVNIGSIKETMKAMQIPMTAMLCILIMLITVFMIKLFIVREKGQIAMLKSIGFQSWHIRLWIAMRIMWIVLLSMMISIPLSMLTNHFVLSPIFKIMGAELKIQVEILQAYVIYPLILFAGIASAIFIATIHIRKIDSKDMANVQ